MKLISFRLDSSIRPGLFERGTVRDLSSLLPEGGNRGILDPIPLGIDRLRDMIREQDNVLPTVSQPVEWLAPIPHPVRNLFCIGKNYRDHLEEVRSLPDGGSGVPQTPIIFTKATTAVIGHRAPIPASSDPTESCDYEGELAVIIGEGGRGISRDHALKHVFGYTIVNDVTSRVLQSRHHQWFMGKSLDGFCPMGPVIVTREEIPDPSVLRVETRVNGELRQKGRVSDMIFDIATLIETISAHITLLPGDVIATGTPAGVGAGFKPPRYLQPGDRVEVRIEPIGCLANHVA